MSDAAPDLSIVVLAAGASSRFGRFKTLEPWRGVPLVRRAVETALAASPREVVLVTGHRATEVARAVAALPVRAVHNPDYRSGQSGSVQVGIGVATGEAALVVPVDQPELDVEVLGRLVARWRSVGDGVVVPTVRGARRAPVLIARSHFPLVERLAGDEGFRQLFEELGADLVDVDFDDERPFRDVDTADAWDRLESEG